MKFAVLAIVLTAASTVSSAAPPSSNVGKSIGIDAEYMSEIVRAVQHAKELYQAGAKPTDLTGDGYSHEAFLFDFYGGEGKAPEGAKQNETATPGCVALGLCDI